MFSSDIKEVLLKMIASVEVLAKSKDKAIQKRAMEILERAMSLLESEV